jgi:pyridoxine kinase
MFNPITRVAAIHDLSGFGRCSLAVVVPTLSVMGVQCCALPTVYLSAHTAFSDFTFLDLTEEMTKAVKHWKVLDLSFDALYSGFLGSENQIDIVAGIFDNFRGDKTLVIVDPVMGDNGKPYKTYTPGMCLRMRELVEKADLITPNVTEASILLDKPYDSVPVKPEDFKPWLEELSGEGKRSVIITGVHPTHCRIGQVYFDRESGNFGFVERNYINKMFPGTGDLYASVVTGALMRGKPLADAVNLAAEFVRECCEMSFNDGTPPTEGVRFESLLYKLRII